MIIKINSIAIIINIVAIQGSVGNILFFIIDPFYLKQNILFYN
nr:MAG TPA_asm: hypothetical protein [Caudoviricetes sp.]